jgi:hypothetical protein
MMIPAGGGDAPPPRRGSLPRPAGPRAVRPDVISADLDRRAALQQEDGGWVVDFQKISPAGSLDWRGYATVRAIGILRRNGETLR